LSFEKARIGSCSDILLNCICSLADSVLLFCFCGMPKITSTSDLAILRDPTSYLLRMLLVLGVEVSMKKYRSDNIFVAEGISSSYLSHD
jgi:hypothetical protein